MRQVSRVRTSPAARIARSVNHLAVSAGFRKFVLGQLEELGDVEPRSMFGGVGLYRAGVFFGIVAGDVLYLKADAKSRGTFEAAGSRPFDPYPGRVGRMQYFSVPVGVLESPTELAEWAHMAVDAAMRQPRREERKAKSARPLSGRRTGDSGRRSTQKR